jgi:hypothetical protein
VAPASLKGGILYLHSNIVEQHFHYREILLLSIFLSVSLINNTFQQLTISQLIAKLEAHKIFGDRQLLEALFGFENRKFSLNVGGHTYKIPLEKQTKLILCQVDLAKMDINFELDRRR